jgi:hypothetical protein
MVPDTGNFLMKFPVSQNFNALVGLNAGLTLARQVLYHLSHTSRPFYYGYFGDRVSILPTPARTIILFYASCSWDDRYAPPHSVFFTEMGSYKHFFPAGLEPQSS